MLEPTSARGPDRVLLVEDDEHTRDWLASLVTREPGLQVAGLCGSVAEAMAWLAHHAADFALVDLGLPDGSGLAVIREIVVRHPACEVLVLSIFGDEANVLAAIAAGAGGYLLKDSDLGHFGEHLDCLRTGGSPLSPLIARTLMQLHRTPVASQAARRTATAAALVSDRELEVLTLVAKGFSYAEVAASLGISTNTVRTHIRHLYEKLAVNSGGAAVYEYNRLMRQQGMSPLE